MKTGFNEAPRVVCAPVMQPSETGTIIIETATIRLNTEAGIPSGISLENSRCPFVRSDLFGAADERFRVFFIACAFVFFFCVCANFNKLIFT